MHPLQLRKRVAITGKDFFGRDAWIIFEPYDAPGWYWKYHPDEEPVQISADLFQHRPRRVALVHENAVLEVFEHIAALRWTGLVDGVCISSSTHPPFFGRTQELWEAIKPKCEFITSQEVAWCTPSFPPASGFSRRGGITRIDSADHKLLRVKIVCYYDGLGEQALSVELPNPGALAVALMVYTPGWPLWLYYVSLIAKTLGWSHHKRIVWPQRDGDNAREVLDKFLWHRLQDLLGMLAFAHPTALLAGFVESSSSGHEADIAALKIIGGNLRLL